MYRNLFTRIAFAISIRTEHESGQEPQLFERVHAFQCTLSACDQRSCVRVFACYVHKIEFIFTRSVYQSILSIRCNGDSMILWRNGVWVRAMHYAIVRIGTNITLNTIADNQLNVFTHEIDEREKKWRWNPAVNNNISQFECINCQASSIFIFTWTIQWDSPLLDDYMIHLNLFKK